jgi:hypothetical protein
MKERKNLKIIIFCCIYIIAEPSRLKEEEHFKKKPPTGSGGVPDTLKGHSRIQMCTDLSKRFSQFRRTGTTTGLATFLRIQERKIYFLMTTASGSFIVR